MRSQASKSRPLYRHPQPQCPDRAGEQSEKSSSNRQAPQFRPGKTVVYALNVGHTLKRLFAAASPEPRRTGEGLATAGQAKEAGTPRRAAVTARIPGKGSREPASFLAWEPRAAAPRQTLLPRPLVTGNSQTGTTGRNSTNF